MKKVLFSLAFAVMLFSSCGSDENVPVTSKTGDLVAEVTFDGLTAKAASSTAIPVTKWSNVNKIQLFLYNSTSGAVAFSDIIDPSASTTKIFKWTNVPQGTYELAIVANINSAVGEDNVATSLDGGTSWTKFDAYNVITKALNTDLFIDLKKSALPAGHTFTGKNPYAPASEIFTAYASNVKIEEGKTTDLSGAASALKLKREISLMRIRVDKTNKTDAPALSSVDFANAKNFLAVENMPVGLGLKVGTFAGGIYSTASDASRIMIASEGVNTYNTADPASTSYNPTVIIDAKFTLWKDIQILPNATRAEAKAPSADADAARRYFVILSGWAPAGYEYADGTVATVAQPVYWAGSIKGVFSPNVIREVNMTIKSKGYPEIPNPEKEGTLIIEVGTPEDWNSNIETENIDV